MLKNVIVAAFFLIFTHTGKAATFVSELKSEKLHLIFKANPITSLSYQLDCLADLIYCQREELVTFWKKDWNKEDDKLVKQWAELQERYQQSDGASFPEVSDTEQKLIGFPVRNNSISFDKKFQMASFLAEDINGYRNNLSLLLTPTDTQIMMQIMNHFWLRHQSWWNQYGFEHSKKFSNEFISLIKDKKLISLMEEVAAFYKASISLETPYYFHFILLPFKSKHSNGSQLENHSIIEVLEGEKPEDRADVVLHELFHALYRSTDIVNHTQLIKFFINQKNKHEIPLYNLLNEVMATTLGNGLVLEKIVHPDRYKLAFQKEGSFYNDPAIDKISKALIPTVKEALKTKNSLYSDWFLTEYLKIAHKVYGQSLEAPMLYLRSMCSFHLSKFKKEVGNFRSQIRAGSVWSSTDFSNDDSFKSFQGMPFVSGIIVIDQLKYIESKHWRSLISSQDLKKIKKLFEQNTSFTYKVRRTDKSWIYLVVGQDSALVARELEKIAVAESL